MYGQAKDKIAFYPSGHPNEIIARKILANSASLRFETGQTGKCNPWTYSFIWDRSMIWILCPGALK